MPQIFHRSTNTLSKVSIFGSLFFLAFLIWVCLVYTRSSYGTDEGVVRVQPVPFSHQHHVGVLGIDCRYCHTTVEYSSFANIPPTKTCMNCHSQIWVGSTMLEPVRDSYTSGESLRWHRVYNVPGFVYFDHSIHIKKGVGCASCHGRVDEMPFMYQVPSLLMEWCLDCHRNPEKNLRPEAEIFNMKWSPIDEVKELETGKRYNEATMPADVRREFQEHPEKFRRYDPETLGSELFQENHILDATRLTSCSVCHR